MSLFKDNLHMPTDVPSLEDTLNAVKTLALAGLSDALIGGAVRELLFTVPFTPKARPKVPDAGASPPAVSPLPPLGVDDKGSRPKYGVSRPNFAPSGAVPLKVRFPGGRATNILLDQALLKDLGAKLGDMEQARKKARDLALSAPPDCPNRSKYVEEAIRAVLRSGAGVATPPGKD